MTASEVLDVRVGVEWMGAQLAAINARTDELMLEDVQRQRDFWHTREQRLRP